MTKEFLRFLKDEGITDTQLINSLFVSLFVYKNHWIINRCKNLTHYILPAEDPVLVKVINAYNGADCSYRIEELVELFEFVVSPADRIVTGAVYTPIRVRNIILNKCLEKKDNESLKSIRLADISCGCGSFLMDAARLIHQRTRKMYLEIFRDNIFGIDIEEYAIERTKILLSLLALSEGEDEDFTFNLLCRDTLDFACGDWNSVYKGFNVIVGNPPYVCSRNLSKDTHLKLQQYEVCSSGHPDLYIPFFQIAIEMLTDNGNMGFITMNTFLRSVNGRALRKYFSRNKYSITITDFRGFQVFESKNTYTCLFYLDKNDKNTSINYAVDLKGGMSDAISFSSIPYDDLDDEKGWTMNEMDLTSVLESTGVQIKDYCPSRHGIATLSNKTYIFCPIEEDIRFYYLESDGRRFSIEKGICRNIVNPNSLNTTDQFGVNIEKVIFPYIIENGHASIIKPDVMQRDFPMTLAYLNAKKDVLLSRDKGNISSYPQWYAFGRTQSLILPRYKLFFPKFANKPIKSVISDDPELMLYNGLAFVNTDVRKLKIVKTIIESELFWDYVQANGKPYASGYYSLSGVDIKHFGVPQLSFSEENELLSLRDKKEIEEWLRIRYRV